MIGRDIVKFILYNKLLDKEWTAESELTFYDYLSNDIGIRYRLTPDNESIIQSEQYVEYHDEMDLEIKVLETVDVESVESSELTPLDSLVIASETASEYNEYSMTFRQWMKTLDTASSITHLICEYADSDSSFGRNCKTLNQLISYLEGGGVSNDIVDSATVSWFQYMRECRILQES